MKKFNNVAKIVRIKRAEVGLSQTDLSKICNYKNGQFVSNVERGLCSIPAKKLKIFAKALNLEPNILVKAMLRDEWIYLMNEVRGEECQKITQQIKPVLSATVTPKMETVTTTCAVEKPTQSIPRKLGTVSPVVESAINTFMQNL